MTAKTRNTITAAITHHKNVKLAAAVSAAESTGSSTTTPIFAAFNH